jgi:hypothetical protein
MDSGKPNSYIYFDVNNWEKRTDTFPVTFSSVETSIQGVVP